MGEIPFHWIDVTLIIQYWLLSRIFSNIFHHLNLAEEHKWHGSFIFRKIFIRTLVLFEDWLKLETISTSDEDSDVRFLWNEFSNFSGTFWDGKIYRDNCKIVELVGFKMFCEWRSESYDKNLKKLSQNFLKKSQF